MRISDWSSDVCSSDLYLTQRNLAFRLNSKHSPVYLLAKSLKWRNNGIRNGRKLGTLYCRLARHQPGEEAFVRLPNGRKGHAARACQCDGVAAGPPDPRSEDRRDGKEWVSPFRVRWSP